MANYPGPFELRTFYTDSGVSHVHRMNLQAEGDPDPGTDWSNIFVTGKDTTSFSLSSQATAWVDILADLLNVTNGAVTGQELWEYTPNSFDATFISATTVAEAGHVSTAYGVGREIIFTFRSQNGGLGRVQLEDTQPAHGVTLLLPPFAAEIDAVVNFYTAADAVPLARDGGYFISTVSVYPGGNEALFKRRYR